MQSVPLAIGLSGQLLQGVPIQVQQSLAEKNRHAQMIEATRQNLSKLGTGPLKVRVERSFFFIDFEFLVKFKFSAESVKFTGGID